MRVWGRVRARLVAAERERWRAEVRAAWDASGGPPQLPPVFGTLQVHTADGVLGFPVVGVKLAEGKVRFNCLRRAGPSPVRLADGARADLQAPDGSLVLSCAVLAGGTFTALGSVEGPGNFWLELPARLRFDAVVPPDEPT